MKYNFYLENLTEKNIISHEFISQDEDIFNTKFFFDDYNYQVKKINNNIELNRNNDNMIMKMTFIKNKNSSYIYEDLKNNLKMSLNIYTNDLFYDKNILVIFYTIEETNSKYKITLKRSNL